MGKTALVIVDCQNDFMPPDGALAVPNGDEVLPVIRGMLDKSKWDWDVVVATQDYHPPRHISFASRHGKPVFSDLELTDGRGRHYTQTLWPDHCIQGTKATEIVKELRDAFGPWKERMKIARKAWHPDIEQYSAFEGYITDATEPSEPPSEDTGAKPIEESEMTLYLKSQGVDKLVIVGVATDFCVCHTNLDGLAAKFNTALVAPAVRAVFADRENGVFERIEQQGGRVIGRGDASGWEADVRAFAR
ncbi:hypothetical protein JCM24511_05981 [Saitozyma sp. JCM 24511]|nr:hypothetical protein JCM24511_05981 [Saitozyma sp. JCM 24511]